MDEVLAESVEFVFAQMWYNIDWFPLSKQTITDYQDVFKGANIQRDEKWKFYIESMQKDIWKLEIQVVEWAQQKIQELQKLWHTLSIVTARNSHYFTDYTEKWVHKYFPNTFNTILFADHFTDKHREKSEICKEHGISIMIEDNLDYALDLAHSWIPTFLLEKPWNVYRKETHTLITKVPGWNKVQL